MPLLDHFRPPLSQERCWESFYANWTVRIADALMEGLPREFSAEEHIHTARRREIDIAAHEPATTALTIPTVFPESFEVRVFHLMGGPTLVAAIALISPDHKDRREQRRAFATKCASYLHQGVSLIIVDIVTTLRANLHNEMIRLLGLAEAQQLAPEVDLYAVAYRPVLRQERAEIDVWTATFAVGQELPLLPLRLTGDLFVPVDFEATYQEACRRRRIA